jgi:hypothetical protein
MGSIKSKTRIGKVKFINRLILAFIYILISIFLSYWINFAIYNNDGNSYFLYNIFIMTIGLIGIIFNKIYLQLIYFPLYLIFCFIVLEYEFYISVIFMHFFVALVFLLCTSISKSIEIDYFNDD